HFAPMEPNLALGAPPAVTAPPFAARMTRSAGLFRILLQHRAKRLDPSGQAKAIEARRNFSPSFTNRSQNLRRQSARSCVKFLHGVAFLSWNQHPELTGSRRATPLLLFQHWSGQFRASTALRLNLFIGFPSIGLGKVA